MCYNTVMAGFLSGQRELTVNQLRKLRGFESLTRHSTLFKYKVSLYFKSKRENAWMKTTGTNM